MVLLQEKAQPELAEAIASAEISSQALKCTAEENKELAAVSEPQICDANSQQFQKRNCYDEIEVAYPEEATEKSLSHKYGECYPSIERFRSESEPMVDKNEAVTSVTLFATGDSPAMKKNTDQSDDTKNKTDEIEDTLNGSCARELNDESQESKNVIDDEDTCDYEGYSEVDGTTEFPESATNVDGTDPDENLELLSMFDDGSVIQIDEDEPGDNNSDLSCSKLNHPVDRGYAWVIMLAVFFAQFLLIGYLKSMGIFFVEFQKKFGSNASAPSIIIGLADGISSIGCFIVMGFVLKKVSPRTTCLIGSGFLVAGVVGNSLFSKIEYLLITHGVLYAIAMSMMYGPSLFVLTQYFNKRRALATSIATCGTSFGGIVLPFLIRHLLKEYAFQGGILMTAGVLMQSFVCCSLLRPVENYGVKRRNEKVNDTNEQDRDRNLEKTAISNLKSHILSQSLREDIRSIQSQNSQSQNSLHSVHEKYGPNVSNGQMYTPSAVYHLKKGDNLNSKLEICEEGVPLEIEQNLVIDKDGEFKWIPVDQGLSPPSGVSGASPSLTHRTLRPHLYFQKSDSCASVHSSCNQSVYRSENPAELSKQDVDGTVSYIKSNQHLKKPTKIQMLQLPNAGSEISIETEAPIDNTFLTKRQLSVLSRSTASIFRSTSTLQANFGDIITSEHDGYAAHSYRPSKARTFYQRFCFSCRDNVLIRSLSFWVLTVFFFFACISQAVPQIFIPALAKERGLSEDDGAFFISLLNLLDFPARVFAGLVVNFGILRPSSACVAPMLIVGIVGHLTPFYNSYESLLAMVIIYGLFIGTYFAMQSLVVIDILGMEHFASAIGFFYLIMGIGGAMSYPIAGILKDMTGTYSSAYHYLASASLACFVLLLIIPFARRYDLRRGVLQETPEDT